MHLNKKKRLNSVSGGFNRIRKSQSALETLILLGFGIGIITVFFFILLQQQGGASPDITSDKVQKLMSDIKEYSSMVIKIGPGNMVKVHVEVPSAINSIRYDANEISINYQDGENTSEIHGSTLVNITGFNFMDSGEIKVGDYPIIIESMGRSVCIYLPDRKSDYCSFEVNYSSNPVIILPSTAYTNDNLTCFVNMSRFEDAKVDFTWYVNLTNGTVIPWHGDDENKVSANMSGFYTSTSSVGDLEPSDTHFNQSFICQATIWNQADTVSVNSSPVTILEYPSALDAFDKEQDAESQPQSNDPKVYVNEWTTFYANYTTSKGFDLGQVMLRVGDIGTGYDVQGIDLNGDGVRNDFIFSEYDDMYAYWANGTQAWHIADSNFDYAYGIAVGDFDNDGEDNIAWASSYGFFTIINVSDGAVVYRTEDYDYCYAFASGDVDGDGRQDDFVIGARDVSGGNDNYGIIVFGYNETSGLYQNFWNATDSLSYPYEIDISEISTEENRVGVVDYSGGRPSVYYGNGTLKWKTPSDIGTVYGLEFFDQDSDGKADELAVGESSDLFIYDEDGTQLYQKTETNGGEYEVEKIDFDGDGIYDDIVVSSAYYYVHGFNGENGSQQWAYYSPLKPYETNYYSVYFTSMKVADVNDDGLDEIIVGGYNAKYYVLNITGDIIGKHYFGFETSHREDYPIGTTYSESTGIDIIDDVNGDAIPEILSSRLSGYVYYGQQVLCKVNLSSELHNMYYNYTSKLWEYYHFFNESGFDLTTPSSNTLDWNIICEKGGYVTQDSGTKDITVYVKNTALDVYDQQDDSENKAAWLSEDIVRLGNQTYFFANYTDLEVNTPVVGLGLNITWTNDIGWANYDVEAIDLDGDGLREGFVYTEYEDIFAFYPNGTQAWKRYDTTYDYMFGGLVVGDFNNDSKDEVAFPAYYGYLVVLNSSGDEMYQSPDMGTYCNAIAKGDLNDDGVDDIVISCYPLPGYGIVAYFYNSSSGNYEELWRVADGGSYIYEIKISEIDDGPNLVGVADGTGNEKGYVYYGVNGTKKFETHDMGSYAYTLEFIDYDNDGDEDEVIFGEYGENYRYNANGVGYSTHSIPGDIVYELETFDKDGDGIATDYVMFERFYVRALTKYGGQYWYYSLPDSMYASLNVADINNDGYEEIMITGDDATLYVFNVSGKLLTKKSLMIPGLFSPTEPVRPGYNYYGAGMGLAVSDRINNSAYLGFAADNAYVGMIETYPRCTVYFNNSESARMDFDSEHGLYYYNRSFDDSINNFTNGVFSTDENWTLGTNWSIGGGKALNNNMDPSVTELKQDINVIPGHTYQINYSVTDCTVCGVAASIGDENATYRYGAASYSETLKAITSATLVFKENSCPGFCGPTLLGIDNVIVTDLNQSAVGDYEWNVTCESLEHVKRTSATKTFNVTGMTLALDLLFPSSLNFSVKQYDIFNVTANVSCFYDDCGDVNVSVERQFTCDSDNQVCNNDCNTAFYPQAGDLSSSTYTSTFMCIRPHYGCYSNDGASYYMIDIDSYCDGIFGAGTGQCGVFLDATGGWDEYYCPGFVRKGGSVSSADCSCSNCGGGCGKSYNSIFDFGSPFFSGSTISNISGALPFYINSSHPMTINLNSGDSQEVVFWLNGTGTSYYDGFSVFAEKVGSSILINRTPLWNTTIIMPWIGFDLLNPTANINTPKDNFFNFTVNVSCHDADCGSINVSLYYDASLALSKMYETTHASNLPAIGSLGTDRSADKSNVTFSDGTLFSTTGATDTWEMQSFVFTDSDSSPGRIEVTWKGHEKSGCQFVTNSHGEHVYLYNYSNSSWLEINSTFVSSCNDRTLVTSLCSSGCGVTGDTSDFVSSDGNVTALARGYMEMWGDTSCPFLYSYNGTGYEFITDINSNGGLGYGAHYTPGAVMNPDPYAIIMPTSIISSIADWDFFLISLKLAILFNFHKFIIYILLFIYEWYQLHQSFQEILAF